MVTLTLAGGRVWDGLDGASTAGDVHLSEGVIASTAPEGARVLDVSGCTVLPGLIEGHTHLAFNAQPDWRAVYDGDSRERMLLRMQGHAMVALRSGITTVRDLGAPTDLAVTLRDAIQGGLVAGADLVVAGAPVTTTGGHCWFMGGEADGELGVRVGVRERVKAGVDWIKVMASGGNMTPGSNPFAAQYSVAELRAIIEEAHRLDRRVAAHAHGVVGIEVAVEAGVDVLEHCSFQTAAGSVKDLGVIAEIARKGILVSPTISGRLIDQPDRFPQRADLVRALFEAGCDIFMSTDSGIPGLPHDDIVRALRTMQAMTAQSAVEVLRLATSTSARLLRLTDRGTIAPGQRADLLVVEGDPTRDLETLERVRAVVAGGRLVRWEG
ncbi:MAG: amidohydrolase family protein [Dehalococcoidia bacterium]|nr:MAG: amidohydrolase family protein [Dehalococcoidia bacterium]